MKIDTKIPDSAVEEHFVILQQRVRKRLNTSGIVDWLVESPEDVDYQPDYLTMGSAGRTRLEQHLNRIFSRFLPAFWFKIFWPKISRGLILFTEENYYQKISHEMRDAVLIKEIQSQISSNLGMLLSRKWEGLTQCTFIELSNCLLAVIHEPLKQLDMEQDIFLQDKKNQNAACLDLLGQIRDSLGQSEQRLPTFVYLSCRANWLDSLEIDVAGQLESFVADIKENWSHTGTISNMPEESAFFQMEKFLQTLDITTGPILYEADNCGEIVFDLCLVEELITRGRVVHLCVKESPMINDVMEKEVLELLENELFSSLKGALHQGKLKLITAGSFPGGGKLAHEINDSYKQAFSKSDLVIIKGQGNFQSMPMGNPRFGNAVPYRYRKPFAYLTGIKSDMVQMCLTSLFPKKLRPPQNTVFIYIHDPSQPDT